VLREVVVLLRHDHALLEEVREDGHPVRLGHKHGCEVSGR
jgi:hypothetical protein